MCIRDSFSTMVKTQYAKGYFNLKKVFKDSGYDSRMDDSFAGLQTAAEEQVADDYRKRVKLTHYWGPIDVRVNSRDHNIFTPGDYDPTIYWITVANEKHLVAFRKNPYYHGNIPYQIGNLYKNDDSFYGMSVIETVLAEQDVMNTLINLRLDNLHNLVNPPFTVWKGGLEDKDLSLIHI